MPVASRITADQDARGSRGGRRGVAQGTEELIMILCASDSWRNALSSEVGDRKRRAAEILFAAS